MKITRMDASSPVNTLLVHYALALLYSITLISVVLSLALRLDLVSQMFWPSTVADGQAYHAQVMAYLLNGSALPAVFSASEAAHFADVAALFNGLQVIALIGAVCSAVTLRRLPASRMAALSAALWLQVALLLTLLILASRWLLFFRAWHPVLFPRGGWDFTPNDLIVKLYPFHYFAYYALYLAVCYALALLALAWLTRGHAKPRCGAFRTKWLVVLSIAAACCAFAIGANLYSIPGVSWVLYLLLCVLALVIVGWALIALCWKSAAYTLLAVTLVYQSMASGVFWLAIKAETIARQEGGALIVALAEYRKAKGSYPASLTPLANGELTLSNGAFGEWRYRVQGERYTLAFRGPLNFYYSYNSRFKRWNMMPRP